MFPGLYTIARDKAAEGVSIKTDIDYVLASDRKPHSNYQDAIWSELIVNSDVSTNYPIYAKAINELSNLLPSIIADEEGDYLKPIGVIDKIAVKDKIDYEEVELDDFDLYQRLGAGFAQTAHIVAIKNDSDGTIKGYKVCVPDSNDVNRVVGIEDGIYSMLENYSTDITVLAAANAETKISGKLPRKNAFKKRAAGVIEVKDKGANVLDLTVKIDPKDFSDAKNISVEINKVETPINQEAILTGLDTSLKVKRVMAIAADQEVALDIKKYDEGTIIVFTNTDTYTVKVVNNGTLETLETDALYLIDNAGTFELIEVSHDTSTVKIKKKDLSTITSFIAVNGDIANVYSVTGNTITPVSILSQLTNQTLDEDYTLTYVEDLPTGLKVIVNSTDAQ